LHELNFQFQDFAFLFCLLRTLTLNHGIKYIHIYVLPVRWFSPDLPVTNGIVILGALFLQEKTIDRWQTVKQTLGTLNDIEEFPLDP